MSKVKKAGRASGARNFKSRRALGGHKKHMAMTAAKKAGDKRSVRVSVGRAAVKGVVAGGASRFVVKALDPQQKCGAGTSVEQLYKVRERSGDATTHHLIYFDRHGWYCEHGRGCPAVAPARKASRPHRGSSRVA